MSAHPDFNSMLTAELIEEASTSYVRQYLYTRYGRWLLAACMVNAAGLALCLWLGVTDTLVIAGLGVVVVLPPAHLLWAYLSYPQSIAKRLKQHLLPTTRYSVTLATVEITTKAGTWSRPWSHVKAVVEFPSYFILSFSPLVFSFLVVPKAALPAEALHIVSERRTERVA